jgi:hypothetical protein
MSKHIYPKPYTYKITYLPTQQSYIGVRVANNVLASDDFWHIYWTSSKVVKALIDEHGKEAFRIDWIKEYETKEEAWAAEMILLKEHDVVLNDHYLNQSAWPAVDNRGMKHRPRTEEHKKKLSEAKMGNKYWLGKKHSPETRKKMSEARMGKKMSPEARKKISEARMGKKLSPETRKKMSIARMGKKRSPETRKKISEAVCAVLKNKKKPHGRSLWDNI